MIEETKKWRNPKTFYKEALKYVDQRRKGEITSLKTPFDKINKSSVNGWEWKSTIILAARPGNGKTTFKDQLVYSSFELNKNQKHRVLDFSLEMVGRTSALRNFSSILKKSYTDICSAHTPITYEELLILKEHSIKLSDYPIDIIDTAPTVFEFEEIIHEYMQEHLQTDEKGNESYTNTIICLDHSILLKTKKGQSKNDMLYDFGEVLTDLKKKYPIIFLILSQLNRDINRPERNENGKYGNYILESDIFAADALLQHADYVYGLNRPGKQKIKYYGPELFIIEDENLLVCHHIKSRNGEVGLSFYRAEFHNMRIIDTDPPDKGKKITKK